MTEAEAETLDYKIIRRKEGREKAIEIIDLIKDFTKDFNVHSMESFCRKLRDYCNNYIFDSDNTSDRNDPMTDEAAINFGQREITFGKFSGKRIDEIPLSYLLWLDSEPDFRVDLRRYLKSDRISREQENDLNE